MQRRSLLSTLAAIGTVAIAGCSNSGDGETTGSSAEGRAEKYVNSLVDEDLETANNILHSDSDNHSIEANNNPWKEFDDADSLKYRELSNEEYLKQTNKEIYEKWDEERKEEEINILNRNINDIKNETESDEVAIVSVSRKAEESEKNLERYLMVRDDDEWYVYIQ
jgi:hypothetical protein